VYLRAGVGVNNSPSKRVQNRSDGGLISKINAKGGQLSNENIIEKIEFSLSNSHGLVEGSHVSWSSVFGEGRGIASKSSTKEGNEAVGEGVEGSLVGQEVGGARWFSSIEEDNNSWVSNFGENDLVDNGSHESGLVKSKSSRVFLADGLDGRVDDLSSEGIQDTSDGHLIGEGNSKSGEGINEDVIENVEFDLSDSHGLMESPHVSGAIVFRESRLVAAKSSTEESDEAVGESLEGSLVRKEVSGARRLGSVKKRNDFWVANFGNNNGRNHSGH